MEKVLLFTSDVLQAAQLSGNSMVHAHMPVPLQLVDSQPKYRAPGAAYGEISFVPRSEHSTSQPNLPTGGGRTGK
jgi:hypothetical protein